MVSTGVELGRELSVADENKRAEAERRVVRHADAVGLWWELQVVKVCEARVDSLLIPHLLD